MENALTAAMLDLRTPTHLRLRSVTFRPLAWAVSVFALAMGILVLAFHGCGPGQRALLPAPAAVIDLTLEADGYAVLKGITFPVDELREQLTQLAGQDGMPAVRVNVPRDLDLKVLLDVMNVLKIRGVPQTTVDVRAEP